MFEKLLGIKCAPLDYFFVIAILIHIIIFYAFYSGVVGLEGFEPSDDLDFCDLEPNDPLCNDIEFDPCDLDPDDPLCNGDKSGEEDPCTIDPDDPLCNGDKSGEKVEEIIVEVLDYCEENPDDPDCLDVEKGIEEIETSNLSGMNKLMVSVLIFTFIYLFSYGIFIKLLCKNRMIKSAWFILLAPFISIIINLFLQ
tara:strand:+ start:1668 stop:2255 length:588 start_codon:yes stop_codon:yes gene_type:complete